MSNIITFPREKIYNKENPPTSLEEIKSNLDNIKQIHIQETISLIAPLIFQQLSIAGFELLDDDDPESLKEGAFLVEAIRSMLLKYYDIEHPFQKIAENVFNLEEDGVLSLKESLEILLPDEDSEELCNE